MNSRIDLDNKSAVVLHLFNYRNSSLIVNFFLSDLGKISAIAKGVKGKKSKHNQFALLQPFQKINVSLSGKQELLVMKNIESTSENWVLSGKSLYCAYYLNELLLRLLPSYTDCSEIFSLYDKILSMLSSEVQSYGDQGDDNQQASNSYEIPLRIFELKLLEFLGYGLNLSHEISNSSPINAQNQYYYIFDSGPDETMPPDNNYCAISGKTLIDLKNLQLNDRRTLYESKQLLKCVLARHLGDKPLKSREIFKQLYCS